MSCTPRPNSFRAPVKSRFSALSPSTSTFLKSTFLTVHRERGGTRCVRDVCPLVGPAESDGDLGPRAIAGVGGDVFRSDSEHPTSGELPFSSALGGGEALEDGGNHLVVVLEGIVIAPRWSASTVPVGIVI